MADPAGTPPPSGGVDPITGFWRDFWARSAAQASGAGPGQAPGQAGSPPWSGMGIPGMPPMPGMAGFPGTGADPAAFLSPDAMRRMQAAFFDAMAQYAEQSMRSPQFLEAMKRSMDQSMRLRQQMDDFLKSNMASAFDAATGGANAEVLGAIRLLASQMETRLEALATRIGAIEAAAGISAPTPSSSAATQRSAKPDAKPVAKQPAKQAGKSDRPQRR